MTPEELNDRGLARWQARDLEGAFADFGAAIAAAPRDPAAFTNRGGLRIARRGPGDLDAALADLNRALMIKSDYVPALRNLGLAMMLRGDPEGARRQFELALGFAADHAWTLVQHGVTLGIAGRHEEALARFDRALEVEPDSKEALLNRAEARRELGDAAGATADLERAARL